jgi:hypothetical protein
VLLCGASVLVPLLILAVPVRSASAAVALRR